MAILNFTGFETGDTSDTFIASSGTFSIQSSIKRTGNYALRTNPATSAVGNVQIAALSNNGSNANASVVTAFLRFYFYIATAPASAATYEPFCTLQDISSNDKLDLFLTNARTITVWDGNQDVLGTGTTVLPLNTWTLIELKCGTGSSAAYELKIGGVSEFSGTTSIKSSTGVVAGNTQRVYLGKSTNFNNQSVDFYYDDFIWSDSAYLGAGQCGILVPAANGTSQTFTIGAGSGSHYQIVNEVPPNGDTSYLLSTGVSGNAETETIQTRAQAVLSINTVNSVRSYTNVKSNTASAGSILVRLRSNTTNSDSSATPSSTSYVGRSLLYNTDPATSSAWLPAGLDSLQVGLVEQSANKTRFTAGYAFVDYVPALPSYAPSLTLLGVG